MKLPPLTTDLEEAAGHLGEYGCARIADALTPEQLETARQRVIEQAAGEDAIDHGYHDGSSDPADTLKRRGPNQRIWNLINKGEIFHEIVLHPGIHQLVRHVFGDELGTEFLLSSFTANIAHQGGVPMALHSDQGYMPEATPFPVTVNVMWMLCDFTEENGGTRVVPGSHLSGKRPPQGKAIESVAATGPAGSAFIFDGRLWHGTGANQTVDPRYGILSYFCRPFIRQQENFCLSLAPEVMESASDDLLSLLGFKVWATLGMVEGSFPGTINPRPQQFVTALDATGKSHH